MPGSPRGCATPPDTKTALIPIPGPTGSDKKGKIVLLSKVITKNRTMRICSHSFAEKTEGLLILIRLKSQL